MAKKVLVLTLIILLGLSLTVLGAKKPSDKKSLSSMEKIKPVEENITSKYLNTPKPIVLFPITTDTVGRTYWDAQHDNSMRRMIANDYTGQQHFTWMNPSGPPPYGERYMDYNSYSPIYGWLAAGGMHVSDYWGWGGYGGLDIFPDSREVLAYQMDSAYTGQNPWFTTISIEEGDPGDGTFNNYDIPDSVSLRWQGLTYPHIACSKDTAGNAPYIHITNFSEQCVGYHPPVCSYYAGYVRCYEVSEDTLACQSPGWPSPIKIPTYVKLAPNRVPYLFPAGDGKIPYNAAPVATSPVSQKVAIAWYDNVGSYDKGEIYYIESINNGDDWIISGDVWPRNQITNYGENNWEDYRTNFPEMAAVYDYNDVLHVFWTTNTTFNQEKSEINGRILWHWSSVTGIRQVVSNFVSVDCGDSNYAIAKPTAGVGCLPGDTTAYNYLYVVYTKFSDDDVSTGGFANGDLALKASSNGGSTWGPELKLTNTNSNGCTLGNCESENWASIAERVDSFLYVEYIYDLDAGGIPYGEGSFTYNPVRYLKVRRPLVPEIALKSFSPNMISAGATNAGTTQDSMKFDNVGYVTLYVKISGPSWVTITPNQFSIVEAGPTQTVNLTLNGSGFSDTLLVDSLKIECNNDTSGEIYTDVEWVKIHFVVSNLYYPTEYDTVSRGVRVTVSNVGNLGNEEDGNMMNCNGHDYLYDFTPVFVTPDIGGLGPKGYTWLHNRHDFLAEGHLQIHNYPNLRTTVSKDKFALINSTLSPPWHWWWTGWTHYSLSMNSEYNFKIPPDTLTIHTLKAIVAYSWWRYNPPPVWWCHISGSSAPAGGYFGIAGDWDAPSEAFDKNIGGYNDTSNLIWLTSNNSLYDDYYGAFQFLDASVTKNGNTTNYTAPFGAHVLTNAEQLCPLGGYDDDSLFKYMSTPDWSIGSITTQDMNIVMSFIEELNPDTTTVIAMKYALLVTNQGITEKNSISGIVRRVKPGDANVDGKVSVSDVVYLINYLFKGGPEPWCAYSDANGDEKISVSDVVYLINYLFKGGPPPVLIWLETPPW